MLIDRLNWRYATKKMNPDLAVAEDKVERILEAVRLQPPVQSTGKVLAAEERCPFMQGDVTLPRGTSVVACLYYASIDKKAWGDDADAFKPGRPREKHLNWNGPFGGDAPRKCPGEQLSVEIGRAMLDAWVERFG